MEAKAGSSLGWVASCHSVEARGRWGLRAAVNRQLKNGEAVVTQTT